MRKIRDARVREQIARAVEQVEGADQVEDISQFKWLSGAPGYARIRVADWRLGAIVRGDVVTFVRCLHRREVYRYFP